ncbi:glycosyltransferase family 2 protein [Lachnospiraceae bacterium 45-W7]
MRKKLSVVIPVYNAETYLERTLDSVFAQTFPVCEVICVDDGSTDGSLDVLKAYADRQERVKVIHKENKGPTSTRKRGLLEANGDYVAFVDADDFIEPEMYGEMMELAAAYNADLVTSGFIRDYGDSTTVNDENIKKGVYTGKSLETEVLGALIDKKSFYRTGISPSLCNKIFKLDKLKPIQMRIDDRIFMWEDDAVVYPFLFCSRTVVVSGKSYYHYCIRETGSMMSVKRSKDLEASMDLVLKHLEREFQSAEKPGLDLMKQYHILKASYLIMKCPSRILKYDKEMLYPFGRIKKDGRILLYGAGKLGVELKEYLEEQGFSVVGWADKSAVRPGVIRPGEIHNIDFDYVIITVLIADVVQHIREDLQKTGVPVQKILFVDAELIADFNRMEAQDESAYNVGHPWQQRGA